MKKLLLLALAGSATALAAPAAAQNVTGTINLSGSVAPKCLVVPGSGDTFSDSVDFGELAASDGTLRTGLASEFGTKSFRVVCTTGAPTISVDADPLKAQNNPLASPISGYDDTINYTASVAVTTTSGAAGPFANYSGDPAGADTAIGGRLANNGSNNIDITTSGYQTSSASDLLVADTSYTGKITIVIKPGV